MNISLATPLGYLTFQDYPDPGAHALVISFIGCPHACIGCHNAYLQDKSRLAAARSAEDPVPARYVEFSSFEEAAAAIDKQLIRVNTNRLVLQGGEPLLLGENLAFTKYLCSNPNYDVCVYTGYDVHHVRNTQLKGFKYLKCGTFDVLRVRPAYKTDEEMAFASPNQRLYDAEFKLLSSNGVYTFDSSSKE